MGGCVVTRAGAAVRSFVAAGSAMLGLAGDGDAFGLSRRRRSLSGAPAEPHGRRHSGCFRFPRVGAPQYGRCACAGCDGRRAAADSKRERKRVRRLFLAWWNYPAAREGAS